MTEALENGFRSVFILGLLLVIGLHLVKDRIPDADYYDLSRLGEPLQTPTEIAEFSVRASDQEYRITPRFDYVLEGVVVSLHDADAFTDVVHHKHWQDFINLRDLCVIWGGNVESGVYHDMEFSNGTWTCWYSWPNRDVRARFDEAQLANNHLLTADDDIRQALMAAEPGDHIRLEGMLVEYSNPANGFYRGTSISREDRGNRACETIYLRAFEIVNKANPGLRRFYSIVCWTTLAALVAVIALFLFAPYHGRYR